MEVGVSDILQSTWLSVAMVSPKCSAKGPALVPSSTRTLSSPPNSISASITLFHRANCPYIAPEEVNPRPVREQTPHGQEGGSQQQGATGGQGQDGDLGSSNPDVSNTGTL